MLKTYNISLNLENTTSYPRFTINQNDLNNIEVNMVLTINKKPVDLTGITPRIVIKKPSRLTVIQDCTVVNAQKGNFKVILDTQAYCESGIHLAEVYLYEGQNKVSVTETFTYMSNEAILNDRTVTSSNEWQSINDALIQIDDSMAQLEDGLATLPNKVDKVPGKDLSTNDYNNTEKAEVAKVKDKADKTYVDLDKVKKGELFLNVKDYGAKGDGVTDDTVAIQSALNAFSYGYHKIFIPQGTYMISSPLTFKMRTLLVGDGSQGSTLKLKPNSNCAIFKITDSATQQIAIKNFYLDGNKPNQTGGTDAILHVDDLTSSVGDEYHVFEDIIIAQAYGDGVFFGRQIREASVRRIVVKGSGRYAFNLDCTDSNFLQCTAVGGDYFGFHITGANNKFTSCKGFYNGDRYTVDNTYGDCFNIVGSYNQFTTCEAQENARHGFTLNGTVGTIIESALSDTNGRVARKLASNYCIKAGSHHNTIIGISAERDGLNGELLSSLQIDDNTSYANLIDLRHVTFAGAKAMEFISGVMPFVSNDIKMNNTKFNPVDVANFQVIDDDKDGVVNGYTKGTTTGGVVATCSVDFNKQCQVIDVTTSVGQFSGAYVLKEVVANAGDKINASLIAKAITGICHIRIEFLDSSNVYISGVQSSDINNLTKGYGEVQLKDATAPTNTAKIRIRIDVVCDTAGSPAKSLVKDVKVSITR